MSHKPLVTRDMLRILSALVEQRTGIVYDPDKDYLLADKLEPLVIERGFESFLDYYYFLLQGDEAEQEWSRVVNAVIVNETYFWREPEAIKAVAGILVPQIQAERPGQPVRIWHAGCGSGEEPYSMAVALEEAGRFFYGPIDIIGTDISQKAVDTARAALYRSRSFRSLPLGLKQRYFEPDGDNCYRLADSVRSRVRFDRLNLLDPNEMSRMQDFDIIFCRNVFIYFSQQSIKTVVQRLYNSLNSPGYLFVAAVESLLRTTDLFDLVEVNTAYGYKKNKGI